MPEALRARILVAMREAGSGKRETSNGPGFPASRGSLAEELRHAGDRLLAGVVAAPASRETALTLLAADALMTYAMEAAAESAADALPASRVPLPDD